LSPGTIAARRSAKAASYDWPISSTRHTSRFFAAPTRLGDLEVATGERVLTITGIVEAGHPGAALVEGSVRSAREHDLPHELLSPRQVNDRFPAFNLPADWDCVAQPDGGVLLPEKAIDRIP
jgi:sarcosine oxidase